MEDTELVEGLVLEQRVAHQAGGVSRTEKAKIGLIQFCISPPKTDVRTASTSEHPYTEDILPLSSSPFPSPYGHRWTTRWWSTTMPRWTGS